MKILTLYADNIQKVVYNQNWVYLKLQIQLFTQLNLFNYKNMYCTLHLPFSYYEFDIIKFMSQSPSQSAPTLLIYQVFANSRVKKTGSLLFKKQWPWFFAPFFLKKAGCPIFFQVHKLTLVFKTTRLTRRLW